jgi:adenylate cyclase
VLVERGFAFVDLCGFTAFTEEHGVQETVRVLSDFRNRLRAIASRRSVRLAKWLGDGAMIVSVETGPLLESLLELSDNLAHSRLPLQVSAGATVGPVILFEGDDYIAGCVNLASHLCHVARGGEVLVTADLAEWLPPWGRVVERADRAVPGFARPVPTLSIGLAVADAAAGEVAVEDPICRLTLPASAMAHRREAGGPGGPVGDEYLFCSDACVGAWDSQDLVQGPTPP